MIRITPGIRDILVSFSSRASVSLMTFLLQAILAWALQPEGRGEYTVCLIFASLMYVLVIVGGDWAETFFVASQKKNRNEYINASFILFLIQSIVCTIIMIGLIQLPLSYFAKASRESFYLSILLAISFLSSSHTSAILRGLLDFPFMAGITIVKTLLFLTSVFFFYKLSILTVPLALICNSVLTALFSASIAWRLWTKWNIRPMIPQWVYFKDIFHYGSRVFLGSLGMVANARIGTILVSFAMGKADVGIFATAMSLMGQLNTPADVISGLSMPRVSASSDGRANLIEICSSCLSCLVLVVGTSLAITYTFWIPIILSSSFLPVGKLFWILLPGFWFRSISKTLTAYFNGINMPQQVSFSTAINTASNILLLWLLLPISGLEGAAWAASISYILSSIYLIIVYTRITANSPMYLVVPSYTSLRQYWATIRNKQQKTGSESITVTGESPSK